jgi:3-hydroxybutyryl-CoA dehydrogenase
MHFFNPAPLMALVEIIAGEKSGAASVDFAFDAAKAWGKTPVRAKDTPGFIVNRVARGYYLEALRLLEEGIAGVDEIDGIMRTHGKFRMGPFELMDLVGLDVNYAVSRSVWEQMDRHPRFKPHDIQGGLVEANQLGRKTGRGFYDYGGGAPLPAYPVNRRSFDFPPLLADGVRVMATRAGALATSSTEQYVFCRILGAILNEAGLAYSQEVATADDIDTAMTKGTNYPNGPLSWADDIGHHTVRGVLAALNDQVGDGRYEPAPLFCT